MFDESLITTQSILNTFQVALFMFGYFFHKQWKKYSAQALNMTHRKVANSPELLQNDSLSRVLERKSYTYFELMCLCMILILVISMYNIMQP
jgi:hypothetical protein